MSAAAKDLIMKLKTVVENGNSASEEVHDALQALMQQPISVELLQETKIGNTVNVYKKKAVNVINDIEGAKLAKELIAKWKEEYTKFKKEGEGKAIKKDNSPSPAASSSTVNVAGLEKRCNALLPARRKIAELMTTMLSQSMPKPNALSIALAIEVGLNEAFNCERDNTQYTAKARTLLSSLKKNEQIRVRLQSGEVIPNRLATMPIHELASESLQKQREAAVTELVQSKQDGLYFDRVNKAQLFEANTGRAMSKSLFFCTKCKSNKTSNEQVQTRSGDEPMTVFVTCLDCGNHWKTS
jgi:transcription elongation factor S-II